MYFDSLWLPSNSFLVKQTIHLLKKESLTIKQITACKTNWSPNFSHMASRQSLWVKVGVDCGGMKGGGCTVCSVAIVACSCDTVQMCVKTQAPADLASSWKASASSEVCPAFEVLECRPGYHRSESPCRVGKPALNLAPLCCSGASETD